MYIFTILKKVLENIVQRLAAIQRILMALRKDIKRSFPKEHIKRWEKICAEKIIGIGKKIQVITLCTFGWLKTKAVLKDVNIVVQQKRKYMIGQTLTINTKEILMTLLGSVELVTGNTILKIINIKADGLMQNYEKW